MSPFIGPLITIVLSRGTEIELFKGNLRGGGDI